MCQVCRDNPEATHPLPALTLTEDEALRFAPLLDFTAADVDLSKDDSAGHIAGHYYLSAK
jgi:hypothetical protein